MRLRYPLIVVAVAFALAGCSSSDEGSGASSSGRSHVATTMPRGSITVDAAASLNQAFTTIGQQFSARYPDAKVTFNFGASSDLAAQIGEGAPVDVFASASQKNMKQVASSVVSPTDFVANTAEIAVPPSNPGHVASIADLAQPGVQVAVCAEAVPCGALARTVFANAKLNVKPVANLTDVSHTLAAVETGEADAGIVYVTDVRGAGSKVKGIPIPASVNASTTYPIARTKAGKNSAVADAFVRYVLSADGRQVLTAAGFSRP